MPPPPSPPFRLPSLPPSNLRRRSPISNRRPCKFHPHNTTIYPDLCYSSLSPFTNNVQSNLTRLAKAAIAVSLRSSRHTMILLTSLSAQADPRVAGALRDCFSNFGDAFEEIRESLDQMKTLGSGTGSVRF
ncbi:hypothetical protein ACLB2K_036283 [Fragaria x ananassa]